MLDTTIWLEFWNNLGLQNRTSFHALKELEKHYQEKHRAYHTENHINECIFFWKSVRHKLKNPQAVLMAIYFHDVIYEPLSNQNEENSFKFMNDFFSQYPLGDYTKKQVELAGKMILLTKEHGKVLNNLSEDEKYLLDIDCAILAAPANRFEEYENQVRVEYKEVPDDTFYAHRKKFLEACMNIKIFQTEEFSFYLEKRAKKNISQILEQKNYQENHKKVEMKI